jgi:Leucine-rich repeat (LRR) protein
MTKSKLILGLIVIVLVAFGAGYFISHHHKAGPISQNNSTYVSKGKTVDLSGQQLTTLPESVLNQTDITNLNLSNNQLTSLPAGISKLTNLQILNVENNRLVTLPAEIGQLKKLQTADFSNNRLTSLPPQLGNLTQLKSLKLSGYKGSPRDIEQLKTMLPNTQIRS